MLEKEVQHITKEEIKMSSRDAKKFRINFPLFAFTVVHLKCRICYHAV